jgi:predicted DNA-binding transcriptional regulator AlpA
MSSIRIKELEQKIGIRRGKIYQLIKEGVLPRPVKWGKSSVWLVSEIEEAMKRQAEKRAASTR